MEGGYGEEWLSLINCSGRDSFRSIPLYSDGVVTANGVLVTITCILSMLGCSVIIFSYLAYKELRTKARAMLFHLSIADLIIVISHLVGFYENFIWYIHHPEEIANSSENKLCVSQAAFLIFGAIASLMWSNAVGLFMVVLAVNARQRESINQAFFVTASIVCWVVPFIITVCVAALKMLGFVLVGASSCYIVNFSTHNVTKINYQIAEIFSYELWLYLSFLLLPVFYSIVFYFTQCKIKKKFKVLSSSGRNVPEFKFLLVPTIFIVLRMWGAFIEIVVYFSDGYQSYGCSRMAAVFSLIDAVGINGQGFANCILFCLLTKPVRYRLKMTAGKVLRLLYCFKKDHSYLEELEPSCGSKEPLSWSNTYEAIKS